jgi:RHS repeat-associated protein
VVTSAAGQILDDSDFYPFGGERAVTSSTDNTYLFTGKERDTKSNLDFFLARYYASAMGRFTSADPFTVTPGRLVDPQQLNLYPYVRNSPLNLVDPTGMIIDTRKLSEADRKKWLAIVALANQVDDRGNYLYPELHLELLRLDSDERTFVIANEKFGQQDAGEFTITKFKGDNDFSEAKIALDFRKIKSIECTTQGDYNSSFKKYEGLFGKNGFLLRLTETFGHEGAHGLFALNDPSGAVQTQRLMNDRDAALAALPRGKGRYPLPPDLLQKMQTAEQALIPTERYAQQVEKIINGELRATQVKK